MRIVGTAIGFAIIVLAFATSSWGREWIIWFFALVVLGGAVSYHLLTSIVRCPACRGGVFNFRIGSVRAKRKVFQCRHCGSMSWLAEGFYWQRDISG